MKRSRRGERAPATGQVRIIGGRWRGSKLPVADRPGLRPSSDRVRETLFNWLQPELRGARCLDLFAGTGALGLEAASRGAASVRLVERDPALAAQLRAEVERLSRGDREPAAIDVVCADALLWLERAALDGAGSVASAAGANGAVEPTTGAMPAGLGPPYDIVFVDPPFAGGLWRAVFERLPAVLAGDALIHVEAPLAEPLPVPADWQVHREGGTREVRHVLYRRRRQAG